MMPIEHLEVAAQACRKYAKAMETRVHHDRSAARFKWESEIPECEFPPATLSRRFRISWSQAFEGLSDELRPYFEHEWHYYCPLLVAETIEQHIKERRANDRRT